MWTHFRTVPSRIGAEMWLEWLQEEGIPSRMVLVKGTAHRGLLASYRIVIPKGKEQVVEESLRNP
ncbi:MAG: hypothetical protein Q8P59_02265 [Dehalococcoidia bacterium]|nr:hypothetical protein [Dehalococcoidia bacterium]